MAATLNDFYLKYRNKVARTLESDPYYQYLFDLIEANPSTIEQTNRILHKQVDEKWLVQVEDGILAIDNIIAKPRRFIATSEAVVPVELAKKITAESVKHLSRNTQFIGEIKGGNIMPSKILNVTTEESFDLYENRFIYTLIRRLVMFIDKRTDIIFWSTGDEKESHLCISSDLEDDYEAISYKLEMNVKNKQSYMETDAQHMEVFKRIDRVRRIVTEFRRSPFMQVMEGKAEVRAPIQRTNLIMKDPNYKRCYALWAFLERYDDVGYSIDVKESALDFDEEYLYQMYTNLIMNYTVFKSLLEDDKRPIDQNIKKRKKIKPKFVKQIVEEIVDDYDIPDVEVRKVIIEEITRAQARIEQRQAEAEKRRLAREKQKEKERLAKEKEKARIKAAEAREAARQKALEDKEKARLKAEAVREAARQKAEAAKERAKQKAEAAKAKKLAAQEKEKARIKALEDKEKAKTKAAADRQKALQKAAEEKERARVKALLDKEKAKQKAAEQREKERKRQQAEKARLKAEAAKKQAAEDKEWAQLLAEEARENAAAAAKAKAAEQKEKERRKAAEQKEKERRKAAAEKEKEKARLKAIADKEKAKKKAAVDREKARLKAAAEKEKERQKAAAEKEKEKERQKAAAEKEKEKERLRAAAEKEKAKQQKPQPQQKQAMPKKVADE